MSGSTTGWKNVTPPNVQLPLPPDVSHERLDHGLEERHAAERAVAAAARRQPVGGRAVVERPTAVPALGADRGPDQPAHGALRIVHGGVQRGDPAGVNAGRAAPAVHRLAHRRRGGAGDVLAADGARVRDRCVRVADDRVVVAGKAAGHPGTEHPGVTGVRVPRGRQVAAVAGGQEEEAAAVPHVEAERAPVLASVNGVPAGDPRAQRARGGLQPRRPAQGRDGAAQPGQLRSPDCLVVRHHDLIAHRVDGPRRPRDPGRASERRSRGIQLGLATGHHPRDGAGRPNRPGRRRVSDRDHQTTESVPVLPW